MLDYKANIYAQWAIIRFIRKFTAYCLVLPIAVILYPIATIGNWFGIAFYKLRRW